MTETLAYGYSSESTQRELSNEYPHDRVKMVFKNLCIIVHYCTFPPVGFVTTSLHLTLGNRYPVHSSSRGHISHTLASRALAMQSARSQPHKSPWSNPLLPWRMLTVKQASETRTAWRRATREHARRGFGFIFGI